MTFRVQLKQGVTELSPLFIGGGIEATPYYAYVTHQIRPGWQTAEGMGVPIYDPGYGRRPPQVRQASGQTDGTKKKVRRKKAR